jgi:dinuclear metal center YbgI/SA1388 family protein
VPSLSSPPSLADVVAVLDRLYPPELAAEWDAVGPVCGDPAAEVRTALLAVDPVEPVVDEAVALGAQLLVTHHPLYLRGTSTVYGGTTKGRLVTRLLTAGCALYVAHTNADDAVGGVSAELGRVLGLVEPMPLLPSPTGPPGTGSGRIGDLAHPTTLGAFAQRVADALPATPSGLRVAGELSRPVRRVAVCGGAGDQFLDLAHQAGADVLVTADLRHHYSSELVARGGPALIDPGHWASEWPWLPWAARAMSDELAGTVDVHVSQIVTDPWTALVTHAATEGSRP